jgi:branched-chain amino acid transport system substrate-binding protein
MKSKADWVAMVILVTALLVGSLADCVESAQPYKIGVLLGLTGPGAYIGKEQLAAIELVFEKVNKMGGINGHPIEWVTLDDGGDHTQAILNVKKLAADKDILTLVGFGNSGIAVAALKMINEVQIPAIGTCATDDIIDPVTKWMFKAAVRMDEYVGPMCDYAKESGWKKVAIFDGRVGPSPRGAALTKQAAPNYGLEVMSETSNPGDIDFRPQLTRIKAAKADGILHWGYNPEYSLILKQMKELRMPPNIINQGGTGMLETIKLAGEAAEGTAEVLQKPMCYERLSPDDPQREYIVSYVNEYKAKYSVNPGQFATNGYDAAQVLMHALVDLGSKPVTRATLRDALENVKFAGNSGLFKYTPEDHTGLRGRGAQVVYVAKGGTPVPFKIPIVKW